MILELGSFTRPVRIEIFRNLENEKLFRARIWEHCVYDMYPTFLNLDLKSANKELIYSSDELNKEITSFVAEESSLITGKEYQSEEDFLKYIESRVKEYQREFS
jgi:hypothetical protein